MGQYRSKLFRSSHRISGSVSKFSGFATALYNGGFICLVNQFLRPRRFYQFYAEMLSLLLPRSGYRTQPRPPSQTTARPTGFCGGTHVSYGRDVGLAESGWRLCGTLDIRYQKASSSEGAKDSLPAPGYRAVQVNKNDNNLRSHVFSSAPSGRSAFKIGYPGFRKASTPTPPGLRRGHTIRVYPRKSQSGAP
jgi:hypothetical protein